MSDVFGALVEGAFGLIAADQAKSEAERNRSAQREALQSGIQWRVADAKAAGVHPLFALGASPASYSPVHSSAPEVFAKSGQSFGRALSAAMSDDQKEAKELALDAQRAQIQKDRSQAGYYDSLSFRALQEDQPARPSTLGMTVPSFLDRTGDVWTDTSSPVGTSIRERSAKAAALRVHLFLSRGRLLLLRVAIRLLLLVRRVLFGNRGRWVLNKVLWVQSSVGRILTGIF